MFLCRSATERRETVDRLKKETVTPVVHAGKVEIVPKRLRQKRLTRQPVFQIPTVQFRRFGKPAGEQDPAAHFPTSPTSSPKRPVESVRLLWRAAAQPLLARRRRDPAFHKSMQTAASFRQVVGLPATGNPESKFPPILYFHKGFNAGNLPIEADCTRIPNRDSRNERSRSSIGSA